MDIKDIQRAFYSALIKILQMIQTKYGLSQEQVALILGGLTRQTAASLLNGSRSSFTQAQGQAFCSWLNWLESRFPESKTYLRAVFRSNLPSDLPPSFFEGNWLDIWFRIFPAPTPSEIDFRALACAGPLPQIIFDPSILAEPGILYALEDLTRSMLPDTSIFSSLVTQTSPSHYDVPLRSIEALRNQDLERYGKASSVLNTLKNIGVLNVCGDPENDPDDPDEALIQGVEILCRHESVIVMTNRRETARILQKFYRQKNPRFLLRAVKFENNSFADWPEPTLSELLAEEPTEREEPEFTYQPEKWSSQDEPDAEA